MSIDELYHKYHASRQDERLGMFVRVAEHGSIQKVLYPGCFVHITPSFVYPQVTYVDTEQRARKFFASEAALDLVQKRKQYASTPLWQFHHQDYRKPRSEADESFDLLVSQYAGFISEHCKRYLRVGGWLLANNSHGDAGLAHLDKDFVCVAAVKRRGERFTLTTEQLETYFVPKKKIAITRRYLQQLGRGLGYKKSAFAYLFQRVQ